MRPESQEFPAPSAAAAFLRGCLVWLLYLFVLWCSWKLYSLVQHFNSWTRGHKEGGRCVRESTREERETQKEPEEPAAEVFVQSKRSYGTRGDLKERARSEGGSELNRTARLRLCFRRWLCCCRGFPSFAASSSLVSARLRGLLRSAPTIPPVLFLLLTGIATRECLEYVSYRQSVNQVRRKALHVSEGKGGGSVARSKTDSTAVGSGPFCEPSAVCHVNLADDLLYVSTPFFLLSLATIGLDIGSHLAYPQLSIVKKQLCAFLLCLFPLVFASMALVFRFAGAHLVKSDDRTAWLAESLRVVADVSGGKADAGGSVTETMTTTTTTVDDVVSSFADYESATLWCFAFVMAAVTVERSSPEFITSIRMTGARGILPTFVLCVTACQDIMALVLFVLVSSVIRPVEVNAARQVMTKIGLLVSSRLGLSRDAGEAGGVAKNSLSAVLPTAIPLPAGEEEQGAAEELFLIAAATGGAAAVSLLLRQLWLAVLKAIDSSRASRRANSGHEPAEKLEDSAAAATLAAREQSKAAVYASFGLLALLAANLAMWSAVTPCELLLAAVITGSGASFFVPCPLLHLSVGAMGGATNVVLFTTMGMRTRFSSYTAPRAAELMPRTLKEEGSGQGSGGAPSLPRPVTPPSMVAVVAWGVVFFVARVAVLWLGGFVGATVASVERLVNRYVTPPSGRETPAAAHIGDEKSGGGGGGAEEAAEHARLQVATAASSGGSRTLKKRDDGKEPPDTDSLATTPVKPITGVRNWIGLALVTQLAIALTLNGRGDDEYRRNTASLLPHNYYAEVAGGSRKARSVATLLSASLSPNHVLLSMTPLAQAYMISIALAMISGPILGAWVLRKGTTDRP